MSPAELLLEVEALPRPDKFRLLRLLMDRLERQEEAIPNDQIVIVGKYLF